MIKFGNDRKAIGFFVSYMNKTCRISWDGIHACLNSNTSALQIRSKMPILGSEMRFADKIGKSADKA